MYTASNMHSYPGMPSKTDLRKMYANTDAEKNSAAKVEADPKVRAVVDDVDIVLSKMKQLDGSETDQDKESGSVEIQAAPKKLNWFQKTTGWGSSAVDEIAEHGSKHGEVTQVEGTASKAGMDVSLTVSGQEEPVIYSKHSDAEGNVFFQRGNETVGMDAQGNLTFVTL